MPTDDYSAEVRHMKWLAEQEFDSALTLRPETAADLQDAETLAILEVLTDGDSHTTESLAVDTGLSEDVVDDRLWSLFVASVIDRDDGRVRLAHDNVFVKPLVFDGEVLRDDD